MQVCPLSIDGAHPLLPVSAVVATKDRSALLQRTLESLTKQCCLPCELVVVDGSAGDEGKTITGDWGAGQNPSPAVQWMRAAELGAATQRNQGVHRATQPFIWFFDDDILLEPHCLCLLWQAISSDPGLGGVNAMITNQKYHPPGFVSRTVFTILHGRREATFAGRVIGPGVNLLPEDRNDLPEAVPTEWLNSTCSLYRRESLPDPPFDSVFTGYSMMEDLTLSLRVGRRWKLANARTARIFHDTQPGSHKANPAELAEMELINRHYVMTEILSRRGPLDYARLCMWECFQIATTATAMGARMAGKYRAVKRLILGDPTIEAALRSEQRGA